MRQADKEATVYVDSKELIQAMDDMVMALHDEEYREEYLALRQANRAFDEALTRLGNALRNYKEIH